MKYQIGLPPGPYFCVIPFPLPNLPNYLTTSPMPQGLQTLPQKAPTVPHNSTGSIITYQQPKTENINQQSS